MKDSTTAGSASSRSSDRNLAGAVLYPLSWAFVLKSERTQEAKRKIKCCTLQGNSLAPKGLGD